MESGDTEMNDLKTYSEVWREHRKDSIITFVFFVIIFYLLAAVMTFAEWYYNITFAVLASFLLMLVCMHFMRYT